MEGMILTVVFLGVPVVLGALIWPTERRMMKQRTIEELEARREVLSLQAIARAEEHARHRDCIVHRHFNINTGEEK